MKQGKLWILVATLSLNAVLILSACGDKKPVVEPATSESLLSTQQQALDEAKALEKQM